MIWIITLTVAYFIINLIMVKFFADDLKMAALLFFFGIPLAIGIQAMTIWDDWRHPEQDEGW